MEMRPREQRVYVYPNHRNFAAAVGIRLRDDGTYRLEVASSPQSDDPLTLISTSGDIACFLNPTAGCYILWNVTTGREERVVLFDSSDVFAIESVSCFGHTNQGNVKIVRMVLAGLSYQFKVHTSTPEAGLVTGGTLRDDHVFVEDQTWSQWIAPAVNLAFRPDAAQPARFANGIMYWFGNVALRRQIITYDVNNDIGGMLASPFQDEIALGYGFRGALAATHFRRSLTGRHNVRSWGLLLNNQWQQVLNLYLTADPSPAITYPYVPASFFSSRVGPAILYMIFVFERDMVIKVRLVEEANGQLTSDVENILLSDSPIVASVLPSSYYLEVNPTVFNRQFGNAQ